MNISTAQLSKKHKITYFLKLPSAIHLLCRNDDIYSILFSISRQIVRPHSNSLHIKAKEAALCEGLNAVKGLSVRASDIYKYEEYQGCT